jgi:dTDP-4-dehydrorhamnose reductase
MRILLTGSSGQVGRELLRALAPLGQISAPTRDQLDLASPDAIVRAVREAAPDLVVNAAAYTAVDRAEAEADLAMQVNGKAPGVLAEEAARRGAAFIHYSTDYVFDGTKAGPYTEEDGPAPLNAYGRTKLAGDRAVIEANPAHLIFRTSWVYAPHGKNFLLTMLKLSKERSELRVVDDQRGAPTTAALIADCTARALQQITADGGLARLREFAGLYNLTASGATSWHGFASAILKSTGSPIPVLPIPTEAYPTPARRPRNSVLDTSKLARTFGVVPAAWQAGLEQCLDVIAREGDQARL